MRHSPAACYGLLRCAGRARHRSLLLHRHARLRYLRTAGRSGGSSSITNDGPPSLLTLAIESSCDDTCVALVEKSGPAARLLYNAKLTSDNKAFSGIHPIVAVESHMSRVADLVRAAIQSLPQCTPRSGPNPAGKLPVRDPKTGEITLRRIPDFVSATRGPGMTSCLTVGLTMAKGLAVGWQVPLLGVHHMQAHALTPRLVNALAQPWPTSRDYYSVRMSTAPRPAPDFPFLTLLLSGRHTQLVLSRSLTSHTILADTPGLAIGDMLDKCGREILPPDVAAAGANVMYGAQLEAFAFPHSSSSPDYDYDYKPPRKRRDEIRPFTYTSPDRHLPGDADGNVEPDWFLTPPLSESRAMQFDFSGLGGQVRALVQRNPAMDVAQRRVLARATMKLAFEHLVSRVIFALDNMKALRVEEEKRRMRELQEQLEALLRGEREGAAEAAPAERKRRVRRAHPPGGGDTDAGGVWGRGEQRLLDAGAAGCARRTRL
ncbi:hypothetical protein VTK56DRAFT_7865 [Thermocarpiscus australiensis]